MNSHTEPIPPFSTANMGKLESCLNEPFQTFSGKYLHHTFAKRASVLFYLIAKNHCFTNGNKRMAVTLTTVFCFINQRWLEIPAIDLYYIANDVAKSKARQQEVVVKNLTQTFNKYIKPLSTQYIVKN